MSNGSNGDSNALGLAIRALLDTLGVSADRPVRAAEERRAAPLRGPLTISIDLEPSDDGALESRVSWHQTTSEDQALLRTKKALQQQTAFLEAIVEHIPNMIFVKEARELRFVRMNRAGEDLLGITRDHLIGKNDYDFFPDDEADFFTSKDRAVLDSGVLLDIPEEPIHTSNHGTRYLHTKKVPLLDPDTGTPQFLLGISEDITERRTAVEAIDTARRAAEQANLAKSQFLANMSHELRTPLTAILGYTEILLDDIAEPQQLQDLTRVHDAAQHLLSVISSVLDLSKIEAGHMELEHGPISPEALVAAVRETVAPLFDSSGNTLHIEVRPSERPLISDELRLRQCLLNLVANGCKFTERGHVRVYLGPADDQTAPDADGQTAPDADGQTARDIDSQTAPDVDAQSAPAAERFVLRVADDGIGMNEAQLERVFDPFHQADTSTSRRYGGTGLGLTITKRFVEMLGGAISVRSAPGEGTTFEISMPYEVETKAP